MITRLEIAIAPERVLEPESLREAAASKLGVAPESLTAVVPRRRSVDARGRRVLFRFQVDAYQGELPGLTQRTFRYDALAPNTTRAIIVGCGPGGLFAALRLIELGIKPIILERGKDVQSRRRDLRAIQQSHTVNPDSNYCFGEGGAGTYSDGKLYTRANKRGDVRKVLEILVQHGANPEILIDAHPHIGSNRLPRIIAAMRETIRGCGGEIHFETKVSAFFRRGERLGGVITNAGDRLDADAVILATGHSARDIYAALHALGITLEAKPYALGLRIEHPQPLIDHAQYHMATRHPNLPAASYALACQIEGRGVYSFCMCPGGLIVPAATSPGEIVVNGMSLSRRDSPFANAGFVVEITAAQWTGYDIRGGRRDSAQRYEPSESATGDPFAGLRLQQDLEQHCFALAGCSLAAPAQRVTDFVSGSDSSSLPQSSYIPGLTPARLDQALPDFVVSPLQAAIRVFDQRLRGYHSDQAVVVALESRTSSPIRIPRERDTLMHPQLPGLFPCGEGAGYAGGIVSAAIDGENCAHAAARSLIPTPLIDRL